MNKKILFTVLLALTLFLSVSAIQASDNITDSGTINSSDNTNIELDNNTDDESVNSNILSTNMEEASSIDSGKNKTQITSPTTDIYYKGSFSITLKDENNNQTISNKTVNFTINKVNYTAVTDKDGVAKVSLSLNPGKYTVNVYFEGDDTYLASDNYTSTINILSTVKASNMKKYYQGSTYYTATFYDSKGNVLKNKNVVIKVNGKSHTVKTNSKGVASLAINLKPGSYKVVATDPLTGYKVTTTFKILSTIDGEKVKTAMGDKKKFKAKFLKSNGKSLAKKKVRFKLNHRFYNVKTNSKGYASVSLKNLYKGNYKIICYNRDGLSKSYKIKVYRKASTKLTSNFYTFFKNATKNIEFKLSNTLTDSPVSKKIIKVTINGKTYNKKTNSKGVVNFKLPALNKGIYNVKYNFAGDNHLKASSSTNKVVVIDTRNVDLTVKSTTTFGYNAGTPLKVAVTAGGVPIIKKAVTFGINGTYITKKTDSNGIASLPINLALGNYTANFSVSTDSFVNEKFDSKNITVKPRDNSTLTWKSGDSFTDSSQTFKVSLKDTVTGKALSGQIVKLRVNSKTYTATTNSNGNAKFKTKVAVGSYSIAVSFAGNNDYNSSSTSKSVSVTFDSYTKGVNEKNTIKDLSAYLKSSKNCQVGNSKIKSLVKTLTKGLTSEYDKAKAIFDYVRDTLSYSFYYNTRHGAAGTLSAKSGNCVDHSHLLVAMFRTAGLAARYVHGTCRFSSGNTYGHVWSQVLIGDTWVSADATSSRNSLGKIVNWNTKSYNFKSTYASLPF